MTARRKAPILPDALLDQLLAGTDARAALDPGGLLDGLKKALTERALNAEMDHHLGSENEAENRRNGYGACPPGDAQRQDGPDRQRQA